jgi:hypothetical protein
MLDPDLSISTGLSFLARTARRQPGGRDHLGVGVRAVETVFSGACRPDAAVLSFVWLRAF